MAPGGKGLSFFGFQAGESLLTLLVRCNFPGVVQAALLTCSMQSAVSATQLLTYSLQPQLAVSVLQQYN